MVLVDIEKVFDSVPKEMFWWSLRRKGVTKRQVFATT